MTRWRRAAVFCSHDVSRAAGRTHTNDKTFLRHSRGLPLPLEPRTHLIDVPTKFSAARSCLTVTLERLKCDGLALPFRSRSVSSLHSERLWVNMRSLLNYTSCSSSSLLQLKPWETVQYTRLIVLKYTRFMDLTVPVKVAVMLWYSLKL